MLLWKYLRFVFLRYTNASRASSKPKAKPYLIGDGLSSSLIYKQGRQFRTEPLIKVRDSWLGIFQVMSRKKTKDDTMKGIRERNQQHQTQTKIKLHNERDKLTAVSTLLLQSALRNVTRKGNLKTHLGLLYADDKITSEIV